VNTISFMTANYVAREVGYAMHGWGHGDRATNEAFRPLDTYEERLDELLGDIRALGFDAIDLWGAHLNATWATDEHLRIARAVLDGHGLTVASVETVVPAARVARAVGADLLVGPEVLDGDGLRTAIENHDERTPAGLLAKAGDGVCVDTGWWGTQGYDPVLAIEELGERILHVHLKDVLEPGTHDTCRWGLGIVDVEACVRALRRIGYTGALSIEHEPEHEDPSEDCRAMLAMLRGWLA
jgi:sugar phosphate isomerase/epimerase